MTAYLKTSTTSLKIDNTVLQRQMAFCSGSSMEIKQLVTQEAMVVDLFHHDIKEMVSQKNYFVEVYIQGFFAKGFGSKFHQ